MSNITDNVLKNNKNHQDLDSEEDFQLIDKQKDEFQIVDQQNFGQNSQLEVLEQSDYKL